MTTLRHIHFYSRKRFANWPDLGQLSSADVERLHQRFRNGVDVWIVQTWLQISAPLAARGYTLSFGPEAVPDSLLIAHRDDLNTFFDGLHRSFVVGIRADRAKALVADVEIVQNGLNLAPDELFIPSWPQPGLIARDPARANRVEKIAYFGRQDSLPPWFENGAFHAELARLGVTFDIRHLAWHDYHDVDLVLAHRIEAPTMLQQKPASKLSNAWLAGVPALLSPEPEYRRLRETPDDFIEIDGPETVLAAVRQLQKNPHAYEARRRRCAERSADFCTAAVAARWLEVLTGPVAAHYAAWQQGGRRPWLGYVRQLQRQKRLAARFKAQIDTELASMQAPPPRRTREPDLV